MALNTQAVTAIIPRGKSLAETDNRNCNKQEMQWRKQLQKNPCENKTGGWDVILAAKLIKKWNRQL